VNTPDVENAVRDYFKGEVAKASAQSDRIPTRGTSEWLTFLATAAVLALFPVIMVLGRPSIDPLASIIDRKWNEGGQERVERVLRVVDDLIDMQNITQEESK
jgi:hypothetical protein